MVVFFSIFMKEVFCIIIRNYKQNYEFYAIPTLPQRISLTAQRIAVTIEMIKAVKESFL